MRMIFTRSCLPCVGISKNIQEEPEVSDIDFEAYASEADKEKSVIAGLITDNLLLLKEAQDKMNNARRILPAMSAIDDPDMDPKNIM